MQKYPNVLLIAGTGRNSGKTTLACKLIEKFSAQLDITAVKISPHFHQGSSEIPVILKTDLFSIYRENRLDSGKDSSKMLNSGARKVIYMEVKDSSLSEAFSAFLTLIKTSDAVIIESPALRNVINPGVFLLVDSKHTVNKKKDVLTWKQSADYFMDTSIDNPETINDKLKFEGKSWIFQK